MPSLFHLRTPPLTFAMFAMGWFFFVFLGNWSSANAQRKRNRFALLRWPSYDSLPPGPLGFSLVGFAPDAHPAPLQSLDLLAKKGIELHVAGRGRMEKKRLAGYTEVGIGAFCAEFYRIQCSEKITDTLGRLKATGRQWSRIAPYGYQYVGGTVQPHEGEQAVFSMARRLRGRKMSLQRISARLAARGFMARNGKAFGATRLAGILK